MTERFSLLDIHLEDLAYHCWKNRRENFPKLMDDIKKKYPKTHDAILREKAEIWEKMEAE